MLKVSAIKPEIRFKQTQKLAQLLQLASKKSEELGVSVPANQPPLTVPGRQLDAVGLMGGQGTMQGVRYIYTHLYNLKFVKLQPAWRGSNKFIVGAKIDKWATFLFYNSGGRPRFPPDHAYK